MKTEEVEALVRPAFPDAQIYVEGEGCDFAVVVISEQFEGCTPVQKQKQVLASFKENLASGELHALSVKAYTPAEWKQKTAPSNSGNDFIQIVID